MKTNLLILFLLLLSISCQKDNNYTNYTQPDFYINTPKLLKSNDSIIITNAKNTTWNCNFGNIKEINDKLIYYSTDTTGTADINLLINNQNYNIKILIYKQLIILKADDFIFDKEKIVSDNWIKFIDYITYQNIQASIGIIGNSLEKGNDNYYNFIKSTNNNKLIEFWNHGYDHSLKTINNNYVWEFKGTTLNEQILHLYKTQSLAKEKLGITLKCFGAPFNAINENTKLALDKFSEINTWFFGIDSSKCNLKRNLEIEYGTGNPNFGSFCLYYPKYKDLQYLVFQLHPNAWNYDNFNEFKKIINYLKYKQQVTFVTPSYFNYLTQKNIESKDVLKMNKP